MMDVKYKENINRRMILPVLAICLGVAACAHQTGTASREASFFPEPSSDIFWPNPPEIRRIQFVCSISKPENIHIHPNVLAKVFRYIGGIPESAIVAPYGVAVDTDGRIYVVDTFLRCVHVFDAADNDYYRFPTDRSILSAPVGVAVDDGTGCIYVTDSQKNTVIVFSDLGKKIKTRFGADIFKRPTGIAVNPVTGELLVVDTLQSKVWRFDLDNFSPKGSFGSDGNEDGAFHYPTHISVTTDGNIIVSDSLNFRVQVFSGQGRFLTRIGGMGQSPGSFSRPKGVASDSDGNIYVVDALFDNIQMFDPQGRLLMAFGTHGTGPGTFWLPAGIFIDKNDFIYVADSSNHRIQIFKYLKDHKKDIIQ